MDGGWMGVILIKSAVRCQMYGCVYYWCSGLLTTCITSMTHQCTSTYHWLQGTLPKPSPWHFSVLFSTSRPYRLSGYCSVDFHHAFEAVAWLQYFSYRFDIVYSSYIHSSWSIQGPNCVSPSNCISEVLFHLSRMACVGYNVGMKMTTSTLCTDDIASSCKHYPVEFYSRMMFIKSVSVIKGQQQLVVKCSFWMQTLWLKDST